MELTAGWFVVETGIRQAWPFLGFADPVSGQEVRLYVDTSLSVSPVVSPRWTDLRQDSNELLLALDSLNGLSIESVNSDHGELRIDFGDAALQVAGQANDLTTGDAWWTAEQGS